MPTSLLNCFQCSVGFVGIRPAGPGLAVALRALARLSLAAAQIGAESLGEAALAFRIVGGH